MRIQRPICTACNELMACESGSGMCSECRTVSLSKKIKRFVFIIWDKVGMSWSDLVGALIVASVSSVLVLTVVYLTLTVLTWVGVRGDEYTIDEVQGVVGLYVMCIFMWLGLGWVREQWREAGKVKNR